MPTWGGNSAWAQITTWTFQNTSVWGADGVTLNGGKQYGSDASVVGSGGVTFTGTSGFVSTALGIGFNAVGSKTDENISIVVPVGYKASVTIYTSGNRTVVADFGGATQTYNANWASTKLDFSNEGGTDPVTLYLYCNLNPGGADQKKAPFLQEIVLTDMTAVSMYPWTANAVATIEGAKTTLKTYSSASDVAEGSSYIVTVDKVLVKDGNYYELNDAAFSSNYYGKAYLMGGAAAEHEYTYTKVDNAVFFGEAENICSEKSNAKEASGSLLSNGGGYYVQTSGSGYATLTFSVPADGYYNILLGMNNTNEKERGFNYAIDGAAESTTINVGANTAYVYNINNQALTAGEHTIKLNLTYMLTPVFDYLLVTQSFEIENAIAACKAYETSAAFATAIDAESFSSVDEVYAFHTAWQIAQAEGTTDYTKVLFNAGFELGTTSGWTIFGDASSADTDADKYGVVEDNGAGYQYYTGWNGRNISQTIKGLPAGVYRLTARVYSWSGGAPVKLFANGTVSAEENGEDHEPSLEFVVTGSEPSIKIGIGGVGQGSGDNTWGTWGYRVNYFTLTKVTASATLGENGYTTFASPYALDLTQSNLPAGVKAYKAAVTGTTVNFTELNQTVPANTGVLLEGTANETVSIPVVASGDAVSENAFLVNTTGATFDAEAGYTYFGLMKDSDPLTFATFDPATVAIPADKAYLKVATESLVHGLDVTFEGADGISAIDNAQSTSNAIFDLSGRRVAKAQKGIYIVNGKKVVK